MRKLALLVFTASAVPCQPANRRFQFSHLQTEREFNETATVIRSVGEIRDFQVDVAQKSLTMRGNSSQEQLTEWLFGLLDRNSGTAMQEGPRLDHVLNAGDIVGVTYFKHTVQPEDKNHLAVVVRSIVEIPRLFVSIPADAVVVRGTEEQVNISRALIESLDRSGTADGFAAGQIQSSAEDGAIRLLSVPNLNAEELNRLVIEVRKTFRIRRAHPYPPGRMIVVRGTRQQVEQAAELVNKRR